jgi:hypothetical protein
VNGPYVPPQYAAPCAFPGCDLGMVDTRPGHGGYRETLGWEPIRSGGGGNVNRLATRTGRYAHRLCIDKAKGEAKQNPDQGSLL